MLNDDDALEDEIRLEFSMTDCPPPSTAFVEHTVRRYRRRRLRRQALVGMPAAVAAAGLGLAFGLAGVGSTPRVGSGGSSGGSKSAVAGHPSDGTAVQLANYVFDLPSGFHPTDAVTTACRTYATYAEPATTPPVVTGTPGAVRLYPDTTTQIVAAANASGGCVYLSLTAPFTPTSATPNPYVTFTASTPGVREVDVDGDAGWLRAGTPGTPGAVYLLTVQVPEKNGQTRDLVIGSSGLSSTELLTIVSHGLS